ncbi:hypothetical protein C9374_010720 [Naegleria lovaniensis]|uniref:SHOCT domain-containing protein n=1 Tax=Naegleria lovaniensis TaxID=51637 RepID=A0AA88KFW2_NAELO|nr:uncharacterized protein C9374_010720 [Naegleria lovaniensis]KAG2374436.1 hypothetical protein C9374_010720 [Naegleria lovaniensis]
MSSIKDLMKGYEQKVSHTHKYNTMLTLNQKEKDDSKISFSQQRVMEDWNKQKTVNQNPYEKGYVPSITTSQHKNEMKREVVRDVKNGVPISPSHKSSSSSGGSNNSSPRSGSNSPSNSSGSGGGDKYAELEKLASLRDRGIITQKEFDLKKKQLLGL